MRRCTAKKVLLQLQHDIQTPPRPALHCAMLHASVIDMGERFYYFGKPSIIITV
jgi:hypothetical protein